MNVAASAKDAMPAPAPAAAPVRYRVLHETQYDYSATVLSSRQLAHLAPRQTAWQTVLAHEVRIDPAPRERAERTDYFGNAELRFLIDLPHAELTVQSESLVDIRPHAPAPDAVSPPWESAAAPVYVPGPADIELAAYRVASPMVPICDECADYARASFTPGRPWLEACFELTRRIRKEFAYDPKATTVTTRVTEVLAQKRGVCQDFAHLMISCLRSLGIPARYVSGYVLNRVPEGKVRLAGADASHAWVAAHCPDLGWVAFDPTNGKLADTEFVTVGWGREFSDVTPLRGVVLGTASQELSVAVTVEPLPGVAAD